MPLFERKYEPLLPRRLFARRLLSYAGISGALLFFSLAIGIAGYTGLEHIGAADAFLNAAMLMGGMGPLYDPVTTAGKIFAGLYALYCGLVLIISVGIVLAPVFHRMLHYFHLEKK
jgi:hypothetical protein